MPRTRKDLEQIEEQILAPYAQKSGSSRGRSHEEPPPVWRTQFQRDRDRIIHSRAFRRLEYKTQVFLNGTGDHLRTRLTHTMEVAGITRNIARALRLNEDLAETIALAHDLGHPPFGHNGEKTLDRLMKEYGGFEHNHHSLRIVEQLEQKYPGFSGLNLTWETREGLLKHSTGFDRPEAMKGPKARHPSLEAQVANLADEIAYYSHDLDDGLDAGLLEEAVLRRKVRVWASAARSVQRAHGSLPDECRRYFIIRCIIDRAVGDVIRNSEKLIAASGVSTADEVRMHPQPLIQYSRPLRVQNQELRRFLYRNLYYNPVVHGPNVLAVNLLRDLFHHCSRHHGELGIQARKHARKEGWPRVICDHLAGMTDRYVMQEHQRLFGLSRS